MDEFKFEKPTVDAGMSSEELAVLLDRDYSDYDPEDPLLPSAPPSLKIKRADELAVSKNRFIIDGMVPDNSLTGIFGPPKLGKGFLAMQAAFCVQNGISFLGHRTKRGDVLYIDYNNKSSYIRRFFDQIAAYYESLVPDPIMPYVMQVNAENTGLIKVLDAVRLSQWDNPNLRMVIFNNFFDFCKDSNNEACALETLKWLKNLAHNDKIAVVYIQHSNRTTPGTPDDIVFASGANGIHKKMTDAIITLGNPISSGMPALGIENTNVQTVKGVTRDRATNVFKRDGGEN